MAFVRCRYRPVSLPRDPALAQTRRPTAQVRDEPRHPSSSAGRWFCFDDCNVTPWNVADLDKDCFGGKYTVDVPDPQLPGAPKVTHRRAHCLQGVRMGLVCFQGA